MSDWLPLTNAVELVRPMFMDQWPAHPLRSALVLVAYTVGGLLGGAGADPQALPGLSMAAERLIPADLLAMMDARRIGHRRLARRWRFGPA